MEEFKYEFNFRYAEDYYNNVIPFDLLCGYIYLHQLTMQDITNCIDDEYVLRTFKKFLEDGETINKDGERFVLCLKKIDKETIGFVKLLFECLLIVVYNFKIENNIITWKINYES